ncbi:MAG TPA: ATP-binding protein [Nodularia sp. (in: cyanobacteria)]|nr:ATP-binding protein [Nodularia sp. (in: cyanobacteria)]
MKAEEHKAGAENLFVGGGEIGVLLRSHDWSQTPLGAVETWSDSLKTAVQILLTELDQAQQPEKTQLESDLLLGRTSIDALRQAAQADAFRVKLTNALRPLSDANEIQAIASRILGESLGANRVIYIEVLPGGKEIVVQKNYTNGLAELRGLYYLEDFGRNLTDDHQAGQTAVIPDVANYPKYTASEKARYRLIDIAAHIDVPLIKNDQFVALLAVHQVNPRLWTEDEVKRVEETAEQTWAAVERARAEAALRESRNILESIHEAFFALDENWRFTYANRFTGLLLDRAPDDLIGKNIWEEYPGLIENELAQVYWSAMRDRVAASITAFYQEHDRWYEVRSYPASNGITVYFSNVTEQIQTEVALRQSEQRYRMLFESIDEGFCIIEVLFDENDTPIDYRFLEINPLFEAQTGLQQAVGKTALELVPDLEDYWIQVYGQVALTGKAARFENWVEAMNRWFDVYACRTGEAQGRKVAIVFKDISERKWAEEILRRAAEFDGFRVSLADALRPLADPVEIQATANRVLGEYLGANRVAYFEVRGADYVIERDYVNGAEPLAGNYPIDSFGPKLLAAFRTGRTVSASDVEADPNLSPDQRSAYAAIEIGAYIGIPLLKEGEFVAGLAVHTSGSRAWTPDEVSLAEEVAERTWAAVERAHAEAALRDSEELKQRILESSKDCIKVLTLDSEIIYINAGGLCLLEVDDPSLILHTSWQDIWQGEDYENAKTAIASAQAGSTGQFQGYLPSYKGTPKWWDVIVTPVQNTAGQVSQLLATSRDITKQKQAEAEREQLLAQEQAAREAADRANRLKDEFLAVLSHELRSPLNPILGWARLLQNGKLSEARRVEGLKTIERNANLQTQLIEDLLDISRIMQGKLSLTVAPVSLISVISAAVETVRLVAEAKNIAIALDLDSETAPISGDAARLQQVVWNLLTNAVKFTPNSGQVSVELRQLHGLAQIRVIDTGKGISPQFLSHVFEYFRQEDSSTTRKFGGLGLGLAIVRQIVEMHGGTVLAESQGDNQGATFIVQLPLMQQGTLIASEPIHTPTEAEMPLQGVQILLVDDDLDTREFQAFVLSQSGATVTDVASGLEALQALEQFTPDVLVSDIGMAKMDGYMLMQQIRSRPPNQGGTIPAIALTAYAAEIDQQKALQVGFQTHITKPVDPEELVSAITNLLERN